MMIPIAAMIVRILITIDAVSVANDDNDDGDNDDGYNDDGYNDDNDDDDNDSTSLPWITTKTT